ncbi:formate--tetrahydrofolate ligase [Spiroplasma clarkii]|uniref:formate--tetrahydrofolate ligase n=1 Tax=Spiroplasma clarkii TaxID=2139 RepID=UPI0011BA54DE
MEQLQNFLTKNDYQWEINEAYNKGPKGAEKLAKLVSKAAEQSFSYKPLLFEDDLVEIKIKKIVENFYYLSEVNYEPAVLEKLVQIKNSPYKNFPVCLVKSQNTIDGNDAQVENYQIKIKDISVNTGGKFILVYTNKVFSMPGLNKEANYKTINVKNGKITGLK